MACTAIWAVKSRLDRVLNYVSNPEKTQADPEATNLEKVLHYAADPHKTEKLHLVTGVNCGVDTALYEMEDVKERWHKTGGRVAFHGYQSFKPGEVTPDIAHEMGIALARRMWGDRFQVIVATHVDRDHVHSHFCVNSVSFIDGRKFRNRKDEYARMRGLSDDICREYGKSVIEETKGKGKHYAEHAAEKGNRPTVRGQIATELDDIIARSFHMGQFMDNLKRAGYILNNDPNRKYATIQPPFSNNRFRLDNIQGGRYTLEAIAARIRERNAGLAQSSERSRPDQKSKPPASRKRPGKHTNINKRPKIKLKGWRATYFRYLYILGKVGRQSAPASVRRATREDVTRFRQIREQFEFLDRRRIETPVQLDAYETKLNSLIAAMTDRRRELYPVRRRGKDVGGEIERLTDALRGLRREKSIIARVRVKEPDISEKVKMLQEVERRQRERKQTADKKKQRPFTSR